jgi:hypothetical protein
MNLFENVFSKSSATPIIVQFKDGRSAMYTAAILNLLTTDSDVDIIIDGLTGELIYSSELN